MTSLEYKPTHVYFLFLCKIGVPLFPWAFLVSFGVLLDSGDVIYHGLLTYFVSVPV